MNQPSLDQKMNHYFQVLGCFVFYFESLVEDIRKFIVETEIPGGGEGNFQKQEAITLSISKLHNPALKDRIVKNYGIAFPADITGKENVEYLSERFSEIYLFRNNLIHSFQSINRIQSGPDDKLNVTAIKVKRGLPELEFQRTTLTPEDIGEGIHAILGLSDVFKRARNYISDSFHNSDNRGLVGFQWPPDLEQPFNLPKPKNF